MAEGGAPIIRADSIRLAIEPIDMWAGFDSVLARALQVFGAAHPHHAYLFTNARANRIKILINDGQGLWLAARRLNQGRFKLTHTGSNPTLTHAQFQALVLGLPWRHLADGVPSAACEPWHKFFDLMTVNQSALATRDVVTCLEVRQERSAPIAGELRAWLMDVRLKVLGGSATARGD